MSKHVHVLHFVFIPIFTDILSTISNYPDQVFNIWRPSFKQSGTQIKNDNKQTKIEQKEYELGRFGQVIFVKAIQHFCRMAIGILQSLTVP